MRTCQSCNAHDVVSANIEHVHVHAHHAWKARARQDASNSQSMRHVSITRHSTCALLLRLRAHGHRTHKPEPGSLHTPHTHSMSLRGSDVKDLRYVTAIQARQFALRACVRACVCVWVCVWVWVWVWVCVGVGVCGCVSVCCAHLIRVMASFCWCSGRCMVRSRAVGGTGALAPLPPGGGCCLRDD